MQFGDAPWAVDPSRSTCAACVTAKLDAFIIHSLSLPPVSLTHSHSLFCTICICNLDGPDFADYVSRMASLTVTLWVPYRFMWLRTDYKLGAEIAAAIFLPKM